jgi:hypothetical protein
MSDDSGPLPEDRDTVASTKANANERAVPSVPRDRLGSNSAESRDRLQSVEDVQTRRERTQGICNL